MTRLVILLGLILGWAVLSKSSVRPKRLYGRAGDAFPFPTSDSHAGVDVDDAAAIAQWCKTFGCSEEQLRAAVRAAGKAPDAVRQHLLRPR